MEQEERKEDGSSLSPQSSSSCTAMELGHGEGGDGLAAAGEGGTGGRRHQKHSGEGGAVLQAESDAGRNGGGDACK
jgi:hypothetical protein